MTENLSTVTELPTKSKSTKKKIGIGFSIALPVIAVLLLVDDQVKKLKAKKSVSTETTEA